MITYTKIKFTEKGTRSIYLQNPKRVRGFLTGIQVNKKGEEIADKGCDERLNLIQVGCIKENIPQVMNKFYGELEKENS